ncbi:MAG: polyprenyl synthetase family protein [Pseudomonadota bacterium]
MSGQDLHEILQSTAGVVDQHLKACLKNLKGQPRLVKAMRYSLLAPGKRIRPFLVLQSAHLFGISQKQAMPVAMAVEMIHCYSLIHDDLPAMDNDILRRGVPTLHQAYDEATAILAGDALQSLAFATVCDPAYHKKPDTCLALAYELAHVIGACGMAGGQMGDMESEHLAIEDTGSLTRLQRMKTGALISFCCKAGAMMGNAPKPLMEALRFYAHDLGLAYQMSDDLIDIAGSVDVAGKETGKDSKRGKATFVRLLGTKRARTQLSLLAEQAALHLAPFDQRADYLRKLATSLVTRER